MTKQRVYSVGYYKTNGAKVYDTGLFPMTHSEACTFKSKMSNPDNHFLFEADAEDSAIGPKDD